MDVHPTKNVSIGIDPYPNILQSSFWLLSLSALEAPGPRGKAMVSPKIRCDPSKAPQGECTRYR